ncbi:MAG: TPM domain-containing protein [Gemmatimonadaceae bacterium]
MKNPKKIVFGVILLVAMVMATCFGNTLWGQDPMDSLRKASPALAKFVPLVPTPASFVADVPKVLAAASHELVDSRIRAAQDAHLGDIAAAILPSIGDFAPSDVALAIYRTWRVGRVADIGDAQRNLGVLILLVPKELAPNHKGECFILTGRGSEGVITDATAASICRNGVIPFMKERDYTSALLAAVDSITSHVRGDAVVGGNAQPDGGTAIAIDPNDSAALGLVSQPGSGGDSGSPWMFAGMVIGGVGLAGAGVRGVFYVRRNRKRKCPKCGKDMHKLSESVDDEFLKPTQMLEEKLGSIDYDVWQCTCGETLLPIAYVKHLSSYSNCPECHVRAQKTTRRTIRAATYSSTGLAEKKFHCESCGRTKTQKIVLSQLTTSSSSGGSSGGSSSGGSSFGGSGSSSGGGGGSSY